MIWFTEAPPLLLLMGQLNGRAEQLVFWCGQNKLELNPLPKNAVSTVDHPHKHSQ